MTTFKARGLVLREYESGESDKKIELLCVNHGRLPVYARGARKVKSKFLAASQMLTYGDYIIADGGRFFSMTQAEVIESFYPIRQDYEKLCHAQCILEICEKAVPARTPCDEILKVALKALQHISGDPKKSSAAIAPGQALRVFLFRFLLTSGLAPEMSQCCVCGEDPYGPGCKFYSEGVVCPNCQPPGNKVFMPLSPTAREAVNYMLASDVNGAFRFQVSDAVLDEIAQAAQLCWSDHFELYSRLNPINLQEIP